MQIKRESSACHAVSWGVFFCRCRFVFALISWHQLVFSHIEQSTSRLSKEKWINWLIFLSYWVCLFFFSLLSCAAGMSGCGCRWSTQTFPRVLKWPSQCGTSMDPVKLSLWVELRSPFLANMGESNFTFLSVVYYSKSQKAARKQTNKHLSF